MLDLLFKPILGAFLFIINDFALKINLFGLISGD